MSAHPIIPLRWYEDLMLRFLVRSPRIRRIVVIQDDPNTPIGLHPELEYLERMYREG